MKKNENKILKNIRKNRGISLVNFSRMIGISISYLSLIEKGERNLTQEIVNKIITNLPDLSLNERHDLENIIKQDRMGNIEKTQKYILNLITQFFYRLKNKIDGLEELAKQIIELISKLKEKYLTDEMLMFKI